MCTWSRARRGFPELFAQQLHAAAQIDAHGPMSQSRAFRDFRAGHSFNESKDQRFAVGLGQGAQHRQNRGRLLLGGMVGRPCLYLVFLHWFREFILRYGFPVVIVRAVSSYGSEPGAKTRVISQSVKLPQSGEKDFLDEVINLTGRDAREQDTVNHPGITFVEAAKGSAVPVAGRADEGAIFGRFAGRPGTHSLTFQRCASKVNDVAHI
jgi:hypothetical protein